jgi:glycosyltransferase involved in cell wall biosynthesis
MDGAAVAVSVIIPLHNSGRFVAETVASVLAQSRGDFEVVLVDDGSTDDTREVAARLLEADGGRRLRLLRQANAGVAAARNRGVAESRGRYILPLDADDLVTPTMLEECAAVLDAEPGIALVYSDRQDFGDVGGRWSAGRFEVERLKYFNQIGYCTLFRKTLWEDLGGFRPNVSGFDDWDFWLAAAGRGYRGRHLPKPFLRHRRHRQSQLWRLLDGYERLHAQIILNNRTLYSGDEVAMAERFLATGESELLLRMAKLVFLNRYYAGYDAAQS